MAESARPVATNLWGTPDPRDADAYPKETASNEVWAWEFLRRRDDFRKLWQRRVLPMLPDTGGLSVERISVRIVRTEQEKLEAERELRNSSLPLDDRLQDEFGIVGNRQNPTCDPRVRCPPTFGGRAVVKVDWHSNEIEPPYIMLKFDARLPKDLLLKGASYWIEWAKKEFHISGLENTRLRPDKFAQYLRLLDFRMANARDPEIGKHLFKSFSGNQLRKTIFDNLAAAERWQKDYITIAQHSSGRS
jgi:hypothetical protein